ASGHLVYYLRMSTPLGAQDLVGTWAGHNKLWLDPSQPVRESATRLTATAAAAGKFLVLTYAWADGETPHDGVLIVRTGAEPSPIDMGWVDSLHPAGQVMQFEGQGTADGSVNATTMWSVGAGPDWGWRIHVSSTGPTDLIVRMYIATPDGVEAPAVEARYSRV